MSGIIGVFHPNRNAPHLLTTAFIERLKHRGPDASGYFANDWVEFGQTQLQVSHSAKKHVLPLESLCKQFVIAYDGIIYNFKELQIELEKLGHSFLYETEGEVLLAAYAQWGVHCLAKLRGPFSFVLWDDIKKKLFVARDRCGEHPLFYAVYNNTLYFASELKALIPLLPVKPSLNPSSIDMFLHFQYVPEPFTLLDGVHKLSAAHYMFISPEQLLTPIQPECYWSIEDIPECTQEPAQIVLERVKESVSLALQVDAPIGIALSGGLDSSTLVSLAVQLRDKSQLQVFSIGYPGRPKYDEREQARILAKELNLEFHEVEIPVNDFVSFLPQLVRIMDEPIADPSYFAHYAVPKAVADYGLKILLSGVGGDEVFGGYPWITQNILLNKKRMLARRLPQFLINRFCFSQSFATKICKEDSAIWQMLQQSITPKNQHIFLEFIPSFKEAFVLKKEYYGSAMHTIPENNLFTPTQITLKKEKDIPLQMYQLLFHTWLASSCLALGDRVGMAVGVETRLPFLDVKLIETVMGLRKHRSDHTLQPKVWLCDAMKDILPAEVLMRSKKGFRPPVSEWLLTAVKEYGHLLVGGKLVQAGILSTNIADAVNSGKAIHGWPSLNFFYKLLLLELWVRFILEE